MDVGVVPPPLEALTLESRYTDVDRPVLLSGTQALVRVLLEQARLDRAAGLKTGGLVSGYRGSPLGGLDLELWRREALLTASGIRFQPGLNEDLAATMLWGSQGIDAFPGKRVEGVFGMWYGKGPGVDRSADALRCANALGTSARGGVLAVSGDDHAAHSSVFPHQTDGIFQSVHIPVLVPADVQDIVDLGLAGLAASRFSGLWVGLKTIAETAEQHSLATLPSNRQFANPAFEQPRHGLNIDPTLAWPAERREIERRLLRERLPAFHAWVRANRLDSLRYGSDRATVGIVTIGKGHLDALHALRRLGLADHPEIAVYKVALAWPIEPEGLRSFARGKRVLLVVEEKRSLVEMQLRDTLYDLPDRPVVLGKRDDLLPETMEFTPEILMAALVRSLPQFGIEATMPDIAIWPREADTMVRAPMFCAGCPHNTSTALPEGSHAVAGIGCHIMAVNTSETTRTFSQMGGEGVPWVGLEHFTDLPHMFANMGDGTYQHSGLLAIRQAVAARSRITYKLLYNDAVAMTGGQPAEGGPTVIGMARQLHAEGVGLIAIVTDDEARLPSTAELPPGVLRHGRAELDQVQRLLRDHEGVSALIYDQVCATEKRRRRKRGKMADAATHVSINAAICENCGDCTTQSNCIAIEPIETDHGRKRRVSPTSCNTDLSCLKGFCPSFVTSKGTAPAIDHAATWLAREAELIASLPPSAPVALTRPWRGLFAGIGGGGIVTTGAVVAMAAHIEGRAVSTLDFTGLAQKNGAVVSHVQIAPERGLDVVRIPAGEADLLLAADLAVATDPDVLNKCAAHAGAVGNTDLPAGADFMRNRDLRVDAGLHRRAIERRVDRSRSRFFRATAVAERLFGTAQAANTLLLGHAWQLGLIPLGEPALLRAIKLNGTAVALNERAFRWGRLLAERPALIDEILADQVSLPTDLPSLQARREAELLAYGGPRLVRRFRSLVDAVGQREAELSGNPGALTRAVIDAFHRVLAIKDEYEVARLHAGTDYGTDPVFHLSPPLPLGKDKATGRPRKIAISGTLALPLFRALRHGKVLRGTLLDVFGWQAERRAERALASEYERDVRAMLPRLTAETLEQAQQLAELPWAIRGFGPVKRAAMEAVVPIRQRLRQALA